MTPFQKDIVRALVSSPEDFRILKKAAENKKVFNQYLNRIWPYTIRPKKGPKISSKIEIGTENEVRAVLEKILSNRASFYRDGNNFEIEINCKHETLGIVQRMRLILEDESWLKRGNYMFTAYLHKRGIIESKMWNGKENPIIFLLDFLIQGMSGCEKIIFNCHGGRINERECLDGFFEVVEKIIKFCKRKFSPKKPKSIQTSLNLGIEIEYEGKMYSNFNFRKKTDKEFRNGIISFHSGYDGNSSSRLNENRLRINGIFGIRALYELLEMMKSYDDKITVNSGLHVHVDVGKHKEITGIHGFGYFKYLLNDSHIKELMLKIFFNGSSMLFYLKNGNIDRFNEEFYSTFGDISTSKGFNTIEYRFLKPTLDYTRMMIQLLACIHINKKIIELAKTRKSIDEIELKKLRYDVSLNTEYLEFLAELACENNI